MPTEDRQPMNTDTAERPTPPDPALSRERLEQIKARAERAQQIVKLTQQLAELRADQEPT